MNEEIKEEENKLMNEENTHKELKTRKKSSNLRNREEEIPIALRNAYKKRVRDGRISSEGQSKINIPQEEGFKYRGAVDYGHTGDRLAELVRAGWDFVDYNGQTVDASQPSQLGKRATYPAGAGEIGYYMRIPMEIWKEDEMKKQEYNDEIMSQIGDLPIKNVPHGQETGKVKIQHGVENPRK